MKYYYFSGSIFKVTKTANISCSACVVYIYTDFTAIFIYRFYLYNIVPAQADKNTLH